MCNLSGGDTLLSNKTHQRRRGAEEDDLGSLRGFSRCSIVSLCITVFMWLWEPLRTVCKTWHFFQRCGGGGSLEITGALKLQLLNDLPAKPPNKYTPNSWHCAHTICKFNLKNLAWTCAQSILFVMSSTPVVGLKATPLRCGFVKQVFPEPERNQM